MRHPSPKTRSTSFAIKFVVCILLLQGLIECIPKFLVARKSRPLEEHLLWQAELRHVYSRMQSQVRVNLSAKCQSLLCSGHELAIGHLLCN